MKIIAGLGNPGREYENTKHNVGFMTVDRLAEKLGISIKKIKFKALCGEGFIGGEKVLILKPQTYMNLSGESVREAMFFYKLDIEDLIVIYDDIDIPLGHLRIRPKGSAGTHNGMRSIIYQLQDDGFPRVRVGIGGERKGDLADYVISGFDKDSAKLMRDAITAAADAVECLVADGINEAMSRFNTKKEKKKKVKETDKKAEAAGAQPETEKKEKETAKAVQPEAENIKSRSAETEAQPATETEARPAAEKKISLLRWARGLNRK